MTNHEKRLEELCGAELAAKKALSDYKREHETMLLGCAFGMNTAGDAMVAINLETGEEFSMDELGKLMDLDAPEPKDECYIYRRGSRFFKASCGMEVTVASWPTSVVKISPPLEPKPDFYVGWEGETKGGARATIFAEIDGRWFGALGSKAAGMVPFNWCADGQPVWATAGCLDDELAPNPEPDIWHRKVGGHLAFKTYDEAKSMHGGVAYEKVELRVIK